MTFIGFVCYAQTASGSCKLPGTYDYVNVDYYWEDDHLAVSNQSGTTITQLHIKVTCNLWYDIKETGRVTKAGSLTIVDQTYYDIPPNQTTIITDGLKHFPKEKVYKKNNGETAERHFEDFSVEVGNLICK